MQYESRAKLELILNDLLRTQDTKQAAYDIQDLFTEDKKHNGWTNYETWLMFTILSNDQGLFSEAQGIAEDSESEYEASCNLKQWLEECFYNEELSIFRIDCESWTDRDFQEVDFMEIVKGLRER